MQVVARPDWRVSLKEHHQGYISCEEFEKNAERLEKNRTNGEETVLSGPARERLGTVARDAAVWQLWPGAHRALLRQRWYVSNLSLQPLATRRACQQLLHEFSL